MGRERELKVTILGDASGAKRAFGELGDASDGIGARIAGVGKVIGTAMVGAGLAAGAFGVKSVMAASDLNEQISKVGVVFGDQSKIVTGFAEKMARDFGLPKTQILEAAAGIGLVGKASGLAQGDAAKLGTNMAQLAADASSFYNVPLDEALDAIKSGLVGEAEPLRKYGVLLSEAAVAEEAVALGIAKVGDKLTEQQKVQARSSLITKGMKDATGDLARTQDGLANRLRELKGRAENFAASVGTALLPMVLRAFDLFEKLSGILRQNVEPVFRTVRLGVLALVAAFKDGDVTSDGFVGAMERIGVFLKDNLIPAFRNFVGLVQDKVFPIVEKVAGFLRANMAPALAALGAVVLSIVVPALVGWAVAAGSAAVATIAAAAPAIALAALLAALAAAVVYAYRNFEGFRNVVDTVVQFIVGTVVPAVQRLAREIIDQLGAAVGWVVRMWPQISEAIGHVMVAVREVVERVLAVVRFLWQNVGDDIFRIVERVFHAVYGVVNGVLDAVRGLIQFVLAVINGDWGRAWDGMLQFFRGIWDAVFAVVAGAFGALASLFGGLGGTIVRALGNVGGLLVGAGRAVVNGLIWGVATMGGNLVGFVQDFISDRIGSIGGFGWMLVSAGSDLINGLIWGIARKAGDLVNAIRNFITDRIPDYVKRALGISSPSRVMAALGVNIGQGLADGIASQKQRVNSAVGDLLDFGTSGSLDMAVRAGGSSVNGILGATQQSGGVSKTYQLSLNGTFGDVVDVQEQFHRMELLGG